MPPMFTLTRQIRRFSQTRWKSIKPTSSESLPPHSSSFSLRKYAVITGASGGIGAAIARRFAKEGMTCILIGRSLPRLEETLESLPVKGVGHRIQMGDVSDKLFWRDFVKNMGREEENCDVLVNAAGLTHASFLVRTPASAVEDIVNTNLMGTIWGCQHVLKGLMLPKRSGCIINVASLLAVKDGRGSSVYAATKAGILGLTRSLVSEVGERGIRINTILPGYISSNMTKDFDPDVRKTLEDSIPARRFGTADEVADAAYFLASNQYANNCILNLDGGLSAK